MPALALALLLGCSTRLGALPVPTPPVATRTAHDASFVPPPLEGPLDGRTIPITLDLAVLDRVDPLNWEEIFQQIAADPGWRLVEYDHAIVAFRREDGTVPRTGHHVETDAIWRVALRFTAWDAGLPWADSERIDRIEASVDEVDLRPFRLADRDLLATALAVEGLDLSLEVYEARPDRERPRTVDAVAEAGALVRGVLDADEAERVPGRVPALLPRNGVRRGEATLELLPADPGAIEVRGWLNPGGPGWTWLRIVRRRGGIWEEEAVALGSREAIGWSAEPEERFLLQGMVPLPEGPPFLAVVEAWHQPATPEPARLLGRFEAEVPAR